MDILTLVSQLMALSGLGALFAILVNILKYFKVVKDGDAPTWVTGFNIVGLAALFLLKVFLPEQDTGQLDGIAASIAQILSLVFGLVVQLWGSKLAHLALRGTAPAVGFSHTLKQARDASKLAG